MVATRSVLITGGTGLLGLGLCATVPAGWSIVIMHLRPYRAEIPGVEELAVDVRSRSALARVFAERQFDAVVHTAGIASVDYSQRHAAESVESNVGGTRNIAELCAAAGTRLVYISTNAVFDGQHAPYRESDPINPINEYGRIKAECEALVARTVARHVIARPILMYGVPHPKGRPNPVTWVIEAVERAETIQVVDDVFENPIYNMDAARAIWAMLEREIGGVFHLAGRDVVSRYELARRVARIFELDDTCIRPVSSDFFPDIAPRPHNTSFVTKRMESELGLAPSALDDGLRAMAATYVRR
jgi:dTDP-4-dehydrorhamnose reductase